jgi:hypothetical protein
MACDAALCTAVAGTAITTQTMISTEVVRALGNVDVHDL